MAESSLLKACSKLDEVPSALKAPASHTPTRRMSQSLAATAAGGAGAAGLPGGWCTPLVTSPFFGQSHRRPFPHRRGDGQDDPAPRAFALLPEQVIRDPQALGAAAALDVQHVVTLS